MINMHVLKCLIVKIQYTFIHIQNNKSRLLQIHDNEIVYNINY